MTPAGNRRHLDIRVTVAQIPRALEVFDAISRHLAVLGATVDAKQSEGASRTTLITYEGESITVFLEERVKRFDVPPPPPPKGTDPDVWRFRHWLRRPEERYRWEATGALTFRLTGLSGTGARQNFNVSERTELNDLAAAIGQAVADGAATLKARRASLEAQQRANAEAAKRREEDAQRQREQDDVVEQMLHIKKHWLAACELRAFVEAAALAVPEEQRDEAFRKWLELARWYVTAIDPFETPEKAKRLLAKHDRNTWYDDKVLVLEKPTPTYMPSGFYDTRSQFGASWWSRRQ